ncbi:SH3 domain-containing protein [Thermodesulfobacteriota bacterium]
MAQVSGVGTVNVDWLNMRSSPGGSVLTIIKGGTEVRIVGRSRGWLDIWYGGMRGSAFSRYVTIQPQIQAPPSPNQGEKENPEAASGQSEFERQGEVTASRLNLRDGPNGHILVGLDRGIVIKILSESNGWMQVEAQGRKGYVSSRFVRPSVVRRTTVSTQPTEPSASQQGFHFDGDWAIAPDGKRFAKKFRKGVFSSGITPISDFIKQNQNSIISITPSQLRLLDAIAENEGKLEAINTWDNAYLSFGIFQWTAGVGAEAGELPALFDRLQKRFPNTYKKSFGQYGLEISGVREVLGSPARGYFKLNNCLLGNGEQKEILRSLVWPYRCKQAGFDDEVRLVELEHALARIDCFLKVDNRLIRGRYIGDYITSEYGIAQLLDQHVNRPAHVLSTVRKAVDSIDGEINVDDPDGWGDMEERRLLDVYLDFRKQTNMTDGPQRAERIRRQLQKGVISASRDSYQT